MLKEKNKVYCLTNRIYTSWGKQYQHFDWKPEWQIFLNLKSREIEQLDFIDSKPINNIICWFDHNILSKISKDNITTLDVRIRIVCGMINKLSPNKLSIELKRVFMDCIWSIYKQFIRDWYEYHSKYILGLPF